jgi:hypothetical protein
MHCECTGRREKVTSMPAANVAGPPRRARGVRDVQVDKVAHRADHHLSWSHHLFEPKENEHLYSLIIDLVPSLQST